jgi:hypothetical protein
LRVQGRPLQSATQHTDHEEDSEDREDGDETDKKAGEAEVQALVAALRLDGAQRRHHGRAGLNAAAKRRWAARLAAVAPPADWTAWLPCLAQDPLPAVRTVAALLIVHGQWTDDGALALVDRLLRDEDWEVREWAVDPAAMLIDARSDGPALFEAWLNEGGRACRAMVAACRARVRAGRMTVQEAFAVADRVVDDPDPYVLASVGSYFLGDGVLPRFPQEMATWLIERSERGELSPPFWRNVGALFSSAAARGPCRAQLVEAASWLLAAGPPPRLVSTLRRAAGAVGLT